MQCYQGVIVWKSRIILRADFGHPPPAIPSSPTAIPVSLPPNAMLTVL